MDRITSAKNPLVQRLRDLKNAKNRRQEGLFLVEGEVMIREAMKCGLKLHEAAAEENSLAFAEELDKHPADLVILYPSLLATGQFFQQHPQRNHHRMLIFRRRNPVQQEFAGLSLFLVGCQLQKRKALQQFRGNLRCINLTKNLFCKINQQPATIGTTGTVEHPGRNHHKISRKN